LTLPPPKPNPKLITLAGKCRELLDTCQSGESRASCEAFAELIQTLLRATVLHRDAYLPLLKHPAVRGQPEGAYAIGKLGEVLPLHQRKGYLRLLLSFRVEASESAGGELKLKTLSSNIQYQTEKAEDSWIFRYEYFRYAPPRYVYAPGHLHVRGSHEDIHFPTGRVTIESIIRMLAYDFKVPTNEDVEVWEPLLQQTEETFIKIARQPRGRA
jgi:hypothetical protein